MKKQKLKKHDRVRLNPTFKPLPSAATTGRVVEIHEIRDTVSVELDGRVTVDGKFAVYEYPPDWWERDA